MVRTRKSSELPWPSRQSTAIIALLALLLQIHSVSSTICYTPDGTVSNDRPCNATASASVCCTQGFLCTSNSLCQPAHWWDGSDGDPLQFIRGTCTDKTWASPECQGHCVAESVSGGEWVMRCGKGSNKYCCSADDCCSRASFLKFTMDDPTITATAGVAPTTTVEASTPTSSDEISTEISTSTTLSTTFSISSSFALAVSTASSTTEAAESSPSSSSSSSSTPDNPSSTATTSPPAKDPSTTLAIGVGVGVGAGVILLACLIALLVRRARRRRRIAAEQLSGFHAQQTVPQSDTKYPIPRQLWPSELETRQPLSMAELDGRTLPHVAELQ